MTEIIYGLDPRALDRAKTAKICTPALRSELEKIPPSEQWYFVQQKLSKTRRARREAREAIRKWHEIYRRRDDINSIAAMDEQPAADWIDQCDWYDIRWLDKAIDRDSISRALKWLTELRDALAERERRR